VVAKPAFVEISAIQGARFHPILPDIRHLENARPIHALLGLSLPNMVNVLLHRPLLENKNFNRSPCFN
jgi:hypothetical protein